MFDIVLFTIAALFSVLATVKGASTGDYVVVIFGSLLVITTSVGLVKAFIKRDH